MFIVGEQKAKVNIIVVVATLYIRRFIMRAEWFAENLEELGPSQPIGSACTKPTSG
jgi:hypothetical protein